MMPRPQIPIIKLLTSSRSSNELYSSSHLNWYRHIHIISPLLFTSYAIIAPKTSSFKQENRYRSTAWVVFTARRKTTPGNYQGNTKRLGMHFQPLEHLK